MRFLLGLLLGVVAFAQTTTKVDWNTQVKNRPLISLSSNGTTNLIGPDASTAVSVMNNYWPFPPAFSSVSGKIYSSGSVGVPSVGIASWVRQNGAPGDATAGLDACEVNVSNGVCFGRNIVLGTNGLSGITNPKTVGMEIDNQGYYTPTADSYGLSVLQYNVQNPSPAIIVQNGNHAVTPPAWAFAFKSEDGATNTALFVGQRGFGANKFAQNILFQSADVGSTTYTGELTQDTVGKLILNFTGLYSDSTAIKLATPPSCTTAASAGATCNTTVTWNTPFADTSYSTFCTIQAATGTPYVVNEQSGRTGAHAIIQTAALTASAAGGTLNCLAIHY